MKVRLYCDNNANIHSSREEVVDLIVDWDYTQEECDALSASDLNTIALEWANEFLEISCFKIEEDK